MFLITPVIENGDTYEHNNARIGAIVRAKLIVELRIRFIAVSNDDGSILMIFTAKHFNISPLLTKDRMLLVVQVYDVQKEEIILQKFLFDFLDNTTAKLFYKYVKEDEPPVTDNMITVVVPSRISYLYYGTIRHYSPK